MGIASSFSLRDTLSYESSTAEVLRAMGFVLASYDTLRASYKANEEILVKQDILIQSLYVQSKKDTDLLDAMNKSNTKLLHSLGLRNKELTREKKKRRQAYRLLPVAFAGGAVVGAIIAFAVR